MSDDTRTTAERLTAVMDGMTAVGKDRKAPKDVGGYQFRGIEDVMNALHPLLADNGLSLAARTLEHSIYYGRTGTGKERRDALVHVAYAVRGPDGSEVDLGTWWGEGSATDDKGTNKAYSAALKLCLLQTFVIPTEDAIDTEAFAEPEQSEPTVDAKQYAESERQQQQLGELAAQVKGLVARLTTESRSKWDGSKAAKLYVEAFKGGELTEELARDAVRWLEEHGEFAPAGVDPQTGEVNPVAKAREAARPEPPAELIVDDEPF